MTRKVFVSHSYKDRDYANLFVSLLKDFGFREEDIFYSSQLETGIKTGELIFDRLKIELKESPILLYFLSENYYQSTICMNEMGASWMMTEEHYPIALPDFSLDNLKGVINADRLTLLLNEDFNEMQLFHLVNHLCEKADVVIPSAVDYQKEDYISPVYKQLKEMIQQEFFLRPGKDGYFETILEDQREVKETHNCFKLPKMIDPKFLGEPELTEDESHWLQFYKSKGEFRTQDKVRFKLSKKQPEKKKSNLMRSFYVASIERVE